MNITMTGTVVQAKRYSMDGNKGASVFLTQPTSGDNDDVCGLDIMKLTADYGIVDQLRNSIPCECKITAQPVAGAQQKMAFKVVSIEPIAKRPAQQA